MHAAGRGDGHRRLTQGAAIAGELERFYGRPVPPTVQAFVVRIDGVAAGVVGVDQGKFFTDYKPELRPYLSGITVWRAVHAALQLADNLPSIYATAEHAEGARWLARLGFEQRGDRWVK